MRQFFSKVLLAFSLTVFALPVFADKCKDAITDETGALSSERSKVEAAIAAANAKGADTHVMVLSSLHRCADGNMCKSLAAYKEFLRSGQCSKTWSSADGGMKNNLLLIMVAPKQGKTGLYYGDGLRERLDPNANRIVDTTMNSKFRDGNIAGGVTAGLTDVTDLIGLKRSEASRPVTINHAADYSGFTSFLKWGLAILVLVGLIFLAVRVFSGKEKRRGAQSVAKTERGRCVTVINSFEANHEVLRVTVLKAGVSEEWRERLLGKLGRAKNSYDSASGRYSGVNRSANNPDTPRLSVDEYEKMAATYRAIADELEATHAALSDIETEFERAKSGARLPNEQPAPEPKAAEVRTATPKSEERRERGSSRSRGGNRAGRVSAPSASQPQPTNSGGNNDGNFITGVVVGSILSDHGHRHEEHHHHHHHDNVPSRGSDPVIANDVGRGGGFGGGGADSDFGRSSAGGGSESSWGKSSGGGGGESSFGGGGSRDNTDSFGGRSSGSY